MISLRIIVILAIYFSATTSAKPIASGPMIPPEKGGILIPEAARYFSFRAQGIQDSVGNFQQYENRLFSNSRNALISIPNNNVTVFTRGSAKLLLNPPQIDQIGGYYIFYNEAGNNEIHAFGASPKFEVAKFVIGPDYSLNFINDTNNPKTLGLPQGFDFSYSLDKIIYDVHRNFAYIVLASELFVRYIPTDFSVPPQYLFKGFPPGFTFKTIHYAASIDIDRGATFWIGGENGTICRIVIDENQLYNSYITCFGSNVTDQTTDIGFIHSIPEENTLFVVGRGSRTNVPTISVLDTTNRTPRIESKIILEKYCYDVTTGTVDPLGIMYLGTSQIPACIMQVDIVHRRLEYYTSLQTGALSIDGMKVFSPQYGETQGYLYVNYFDVVDNTFIDRFKSAGACEYNCYGRGECKNRQCFNCKLGKLPWCN